MVCKDATLGFPVGYKLYAQCRIWKSKQKPKGFGAGADNLNNRLMLKTSWGDLQF
jgi:hypothetical protein